MSRYSLRVSDVYISVDVETDGPIPGEYSMLSLGACVAGEFDGHTFTPANPQENTFYTEIAPISENFDPEAVRVVAEGGLIRDDLLESGPDPAEAMRRYREWVQDVTRGKRSVFVAYPLSFDWSFSHYYLVRFAKDDPFGFSSALDMKSIYQAKARSLVGKSTKRHMPKHLTESPHPHTHNALDDAIGQAVLFQKLFEWEGER